MPQASWSIGDRVVHAVRPEWGIGEVRSAKTVGENGSSSQMLTIRFDRGGIKTLSTASAELKPATAPLSVTTAPGQADEHPLDASEIDKRFVLIPEPARDPFKSRRLRLDASLNLYRFSGLGASLLDWAAMQTGLKDPLSRFSRHDLEHQFGRFTHALDSHVKALMAELRREDAAGLAQALAQAAPEAKQALRRMDKRR